MAYHDIVSEQDNNYYFIKKTVVLTDPHFHSSSEFLFVCEGQVLATVDGETRTLSRGDACYAPEFFIHSFYPLKDNACIYCFLSPKFITDKILTVFQKKSPPRFFSFEDYALLDFILDVFGRFYHSVEAKQTAVEGCLSLLYGTVAAKMDFVFHPSNTQGGLVVEILKYANDHHAESLTLDDLSKQFGYSREHISRVLHKHLSVSWSSFISRLRAQYAHNMLVANPQINVFDAAYACGFNSPNTFYRAYQSEFNCSPRNFSESNGKE